MGRTRPDRDCPWLEFMDRPDLKTYRIDQHGQIWGCLEVFAGTRGAVMALLGGVEDDLRPNERRVALPLAVWLGWPTLAEQQVKEPSLTAGPKEKPI